MTSLSRAFIVLTLLAITCQVHAQKALSDTLLNSFQLRNIGPALMSGRIADIAIHPENESVWYIAVGSGGVWKTSNAGTTWQPLFDKQSSYSIGCIAIDPSNPHTIWVGTGENVGGRHVGYGDGVYVSHDDGKTWKNTGLKHSEHISKIIIHPEKPTTLWVAAQGPLWKEGGERGLYKTSDGGKTWHKTLGDEQWTGVTDIVIDPTNPDRLYAATWQRHRTVANYLGGGPKTTIHASIDGGNTWQEIRNGLPGGNLGKIGLAISPQNPDVLYAAIEQDRRKGGVYKSDNRGASWKKMSDAVSGATGPHYYQELYASPHHFDRLYLMDVRVQISNDGGTTFTRLPEEHKHSDNHAIAFRKNDPNYLLMGTDGGLYESFDNAANWRFIANLPLTQFYKIAVDDAAPFYTIYGGTQDNSTQGGPSRTDNAQGISNADWFLTLFADGHQPATEPGNPNIVYSEWQEGNLVRVDRTTGEIVHIQPQPAQGEAAERFNWDAPILISPHSPTRIYFASHRLWRSDNRGDSWTPVSGDLTKNIDRMTLPIMGQLQSWDNAWDVYAMSNYSTITSIAESPVQEGLLYVGTDDGQFSVSSDGGDKWKTFDLQSIKGIPATAFINDIKADLFDANTVYMALDNHKYGDFTPYLIKSTDKGTTWANMSSNLPKGTLVWRFVQDHVQPNLLFVGTEHGLYTSLNGGAAWIQLKGGVPTISFRDLAIQRRENDLIGASFGRGIFVFDDYSPLREITDDVLNSEAALFSVRKAWQYVPRPKMAMQGKGALGADFFLAPNPPFGAVFTYYLKDDLLTVSQLRQKQEKMKDGKISGKFPGWEVVEKEARQDSVRIWCLVKDKDGTLVRQIQGPTSKGFHRLAWDLRYPSRQMISLTKEQEERRPMGVMAEAGTYTVELAKEVDGVITSLSAPVAFEVEMLKKGSLPEIPTTQKDAYYQKLQQTQIELTAVNSSINRLLQQVDGLKTAMTRSTLTQNELSERLHGFRQDLLAMKSKLNGDISKNEIGEKSLPTLNERFSVAIMAINNTYGPTQTQESTLEILMTELSDLKSAVLLLQNEELPALHEQLKDAGAPYIEGMPVD